MKRLYEEAGTENTDVWVKYNIAWRKFAATRPIKAFIRFGAKTKRGFDLVTKLARGGFLCGDKTRNEFLYGDKLARSLRSGDKLAKGFGCGGKTGRWFPICEQSV